MTHVEIDEQTQKALEAITVAVGGIGWHVAPVRQCDNCGAIDGAKKSDGGEHWVFPYFVTASNGKKYDNLCNPCTDVLGIDFSPPEDDDYDPEADHDQPIF